MSYALNKLLSVVGVFQTFAEFDEEVMYVFNINLGVNIRLE